ncbi:MULTISPECIES: MarR family winged helix-turn-helix transcriptional regulator [unclassified Nesterenkonia]|uniref:MarR family winged helix-turn-helix transcriptional regulator n=1 Tax=unclassified Nesterenkonia TaxID=2629769 RepID=UPI001F4D2FFE|nr:MULTISPECIES: MarR family transcriptional regulator [unclassified Nesterenkonia]MCH8560731.1 MarR family transcriptional regulator [Nesterenkonia sp. DZ6]MCH8564119.1 MarR family transcriptional regulator [Nesterenkonia sp. YGD6]
MPQNQHDRHILTGFPNAAIHLLRALEEERQRLAEAHSLSTTDLRGLFRIAESGDLTPKELAGHLALTGGAVTGISRRLVAAGLLRRVTHPEDRRSVRLQLTSEGHRTISAIHADFIAMVARATHGLSQEDVKTANDVLWRVTGALGERQSALRAGRSLPADTP